MKIKRLISAGTVFLAFSIFLGGCGASLKTARVAAKFGTAMKEQPITSATAEITCTVTTDEQGVPSDSRLRTVIKTNVDWDSLRTYSEVQTDLGLPGLQTQQSMQCYSHFDGKNAVRYLHLDTADLWLRMEAEKRLLDVDPDHIMELLNQVSDTTALESTENDISGNVHHIIRACFEAQNVMDFAVNSGLGIPDQLAEYDLSSVKIPVEVEIEDKTYLPVRIHAEIQGLTPGALNALFSAMGKEQVLLDSDSEVGNISLLITNFRYDAQNVPMLPIGAAENALDLNILRELVK